MDQTSQVNSNTVPSGNVFSYNFTVCNTSGGGYENRGQVIVDWELPYDPLAGITGITSPEGWTYRIETIGQANSNTGWSGIAEWQIANNPNDPLGMYEAFPAFRTHTQVLHWFTCTENSDQECPGFNPIFPGGELNGFGFLAPLGPIAGPYQASWELLPARTGDPDVPGQRFGIPFRLNAVPEPGGLALFALGLGALMASRRRNKL
jgi:hypothetical protein